MGIADLRAHPGRILIVFGAPIAFAITGFLLSPAHARYPALDPTELVRIDVDDHRTGQALPPGKVLIIGSGESGCQVLDGSAGLDQRLERRVPCADRPK